MLRRIAIALAIATVLAMAAAPLHADVLLVPSQVADLQVALDSAQPGDVVLVDGGVHGPVVVRTPLTLVGVAGNRPFFRPPLPGESGTAAIQLEGPGSGTVTLSTLVVGGSVDGTFFSKAHAGLRGTGFDEVRLTHCVVNAPAWIMPTGTGDGGPAIEVDVPLLSVHDSTVIGGSGTDDGSGLFVFVLPAAGAGIDTTGDLVLSGSTVLGGAGYDQLLSDPLCGAPCGAFIGGAGGLAIRADILWYGASTAAGGAGSVLTCPDSGAQCVYPDGPLLDVRVVRPLTPTLTNGGPLTIGQTWSLGYAIIPQTPGFLALSLLPTPPMPIAEGTLFMDPGTLRLKGLPATPAGVGTLLFAVPADPALVGLSVVLQTWQPGGGLSAPVLATATAP